MPTFTGQLDSPNTPPRSIASHDVSQTLADRGKIHGDYAQTAATIQNLKQIARHSPNWPSLTHVQSESIEMILHKIGRILSGDPNHPDHWHDIQGYAKLAEDDIHKTPF